MRHSSSPHSSRGDSGSLATLPLEMRHALGPVGLLWVDASPTAALGHFLNTVRNEAGELNAIESDSAHRGRSSAPSRKNRFDPT